MSEFEDGWRAEGVLAYASMGGVEIYEKRATALLLAQCLGILAVPFGMLIGGVGAFVATAEAGSAWNIRTVEDWVGFIVWMCNAVLFVYFPSYCVYMCAKCKQLLRRGEYTGMVLGAAFCRRVLWVSLFPLTGIVFGVAKALAHGRNVEIVWWLALFVFWSVCDFGVEGLRRFLRNGVGREGDVQ